jgi:hypothetical protein
MSTQASQVFAEAQGGEKLSARRNPPKPSTCGTLEDCIACSKPTSGDQAALEKALFKYIRALKGFALETADYVGPIDAKGQLNPQFLLQIQALNRWTAVANLHLGVDLDETAVMALFWERVNKVRTPLGEGLLPRAQALAKKMQTTVELDQRGLPSPLLNLAKICAALQSISPVKDSFFLSCRDAAKALDVDPRTAGSYLGALVGMGILRLASKGRMTPDGGLASQYQFAMPLPPLRDGNGSAT